MSARAQNWWTVLFLGLVALSRWPGLLPPGFSAMYALAFCGGVYLSPRLAWWVPLGVAVLTDVALNFYYQHQGYPVWTWEGLRYQLFPYLGYVVIIGLGRCLKPQSKFVTLLGGGILGALLFYFITNTASWFFNPYQNPEYTKNLTGWLIALVKGTQGWPEAWEFFRRTLLSAGLFTGLFVTAMKLSAAESPADKEAGVRAEPPEPEPEATAHPEEAPA